MKKIVIFGAIILIGACIFFVFQYRLPKGGSEVVGSDYKNATYQIEGQEVSLKDGVAYIIAADNVGADATVKYFGNDVAADFSGDGLEDKAFILTVDGGGSGVFYYLAVALKTANGYKGINAIFLGDRIAPQTTELKNGQIIVNYADRKPGEPFSTSPSVGVSKYFKISGSSLAEIKNQ